MSKASARWVPRLSEDDCGHLAQLVTIVKVSDVINNLNDVRQCVRHKAGKISAQTSLFDILSSNFE